MIEFFTRIIKIYCSFGKMLGAIRNLPTACWNNDVDGIYKRTRGCSRFLRVDVERLPSINTRVFATLSGRGLRPPHKPATTLRSSATSHLQYTVSICSDCYSNDKVSVCL